MKSTVCKTDAQYESLPLQDSTAIDDPELQRNSSLLHNTSSLIDTAKSEMLQFKYQHSVGHQGKVLCNDASDDMEWILSGGEDCTARLWHWNKTHYQCYRLFMVIDHEKYSNLQSDASPEDFEDASSVRPEVTSVAFAGNQGPAITATKRGDIFITGIRHRQTSRHHVSKKPIADVRVKREKYRGSNDWLLAIAAGSRATLTQTSPDAKKDGTYVCKNIAYFDHANEVTSAQHVPGAVEDGAAVVTAASEYIRVWKLPEVVGEHGVCMLTLKDADDNPFKCFHIIESTEGWGWLAAGAGTFLSFWPLMNGIVYEGDDSGDWPVRYGFDEPVEDVTIGSNADFFMVQRADMASEVRQISFSMDEKSTADDSLAHGKSWLNLLDPIFSREEVPDIQFVEAPRPHPGKLPKSGLEQTTCTIEHTVKSKEVCMRNGKELGMQALLSFEDGNVGVWDLSGDHRGEQTAENCSMTYIEIFVPLLMRFVTFFQVARFAFGPATKFSENVEKPIKRTDDILFLNVTAGVMAALPDVEVSKSMLFLPELGAVMAVMLVYLILVLSEAPRRLTNKKIALIRSQVKDGKTCCSRFRVYFVTGIRSSIGLLIGTCSTVLVVPMFRLCAQVLDCEHPADGSKPFLIAKPEIYCFEGFHWKLIGAFALVMPIYFALLIPYAAVEGDAKFMRKGSYLFSPKHWNGQAIRKATLKYQGPMHPESSSILTSRLAELVLKIALPVIVIETTDKPLLQTLLIASCGFGNLVVSLVWRPVVNEAMNALLQGSQLFSFLCMCSGVATVALPHGKQWSDAMILAAVVCTLAFTCFRISRVQPEELETDEIRSLRGQNR